MCSTSIPRGIGAVKKFSVNRVDAEQSKVELGEPASQYITPRLAKAASPRDERNRVNAQAAGDRTCSRVGQTPSIYGHQYIMQRLKSDEIDSAVPGVGVAEHQVAASTAQNYIVIIIFLKVFPCTEMKHV
jgi:hypothetical protein